MDDTSQVIPTSDGFTIAPGDDTATPAPATGDLHKLKLNISTALGAGYSPQQITDFLVANPGYAQFRVRDALADGHTPSQIVDFLNPQNPAGSLGSAQGTPILAPIMRGGAQAQAAVANLADDIGWHSGAQSLRSSINQEDLTTPTSAGNVVQQIEAGHYGSALASVPSAVLEGALPAAATIGAGVAAGPAAGVATAAGLGALTQGDAIARARAANNGRSAPDGDDLALGMAAGAGVGAVGSIGLPGAVGSAVGTGLKGALMSTAAHAGADAAQPQMASLAGSVGTQNGAQMAPGSDSAAAALEGLATRGAMATPDVLNIPTARSQAQAARYGAMTPDQQQQTQNVVAAHQAMQDVMAGSLGTADAKPRAAAATASDGIMQNAAKLAVTLANQGIIDGDDGKTIGAAMSAAQSRGSVLTQDHLDAIDGLGLDPADATSLKNAAVQMNLLSDPDTLRASQGPFQGLFHALGSHTGGAIAGSLIGGPVGAGAGYMAGAVIRPVLGGALSRLGQSLDGSMGFGKSPLQRSADDGRAMLTAAGVPVPSATDDLHAAVMRTRSVIAAQRALMTGGLPPMLQAAANRAEATQAMPGLTATSMHAAQGLATTPTQAPDPIAAAQARADAQKALESPTATPGGMSGSQGNTYAPDTSGLSQEALAQAARLPQWVYGLGADLQGALRVSGQARPVNMAGEVNDALNSLQSKGWLDDDIVDGLKAHSGRVVPLLYGLIRQEMLLKNGIDRTVGGGGVATGGVGTENTTGGVAGQ